MVYINLQIEDKKLFPPIPLKNPPNSMNRWIFYWAFMASRISRARISTVPLVPPASFFRHSPSVSNRPSPILSPQGLTASRIPKWSKGSFFNSLDRAIISGLTRIKARRAAPVLILYFRPAQAFGKKA